MNKDYDISHFHYLTQDLPGRSHAEQAALACAGGVRWVQYRTKGLPLSEWIAQGRAVKEITDAFGAILIVNDSAEVARALGAHGVHLGRQDASPGEVRAYLGPDAIIGATVNNWEDLDRVLQYDINYIGMGPWRFTHTKENLSEVLPREELAALISAVPEQIPVILIGGIQADDLLAIHAIGAYGMAVSSAINLDPEPGLAALDFVQQTLQLFQS